MKKIRISSLAKDLGVKNSLLISKCQEKGLVHITHHANTITPAQAELIKQLFVPKTDIPISKREIREQDSTATHTMEAENGKPTQQVKEGDSVTNQGPGKKDIFPQPLLLRKDTQTRQKQDTKLLLAQNSWGGESARSLLPQKKGEMHEIRTKIKKKTSFLCTILQRYITVEWLKTFVPSLACFECLIFLGFAVELLHKGLDIIYLRALIPHILLQAFPYSIPAALLTATTVTYGRLSADREILAIQTTGIPIHKIALPVLAIGVVFTFITLALSAEILPWSRFKIKLLQERAINTMLASQLASFQKKIDLHPYQIYVGHVENNINKDIAVIQYAEGYVTDVILAREGHIQVDEAKNKIFLTLRHGEFVKLDYEKSGEIPRLGEFQETTFDIPMKEKSRTDSAKHMTVFQLWKRNREINRELIRGLQDSTHKDRKELSKDLAGYQEKLANLYKTQRKLKSELKDSIKNLARQKAKIEGSENERKIAKNYILVANENLIQMKREQKTNDDNTADMDTKIMQIKETIERERQRIYTMEQQALNAQEIQKREMNTINSISQSIEEITTKQDRLQKQIFILEEELDVANKKNLKRKNNISIHKRLSHSFSCMSFIVIGIPLGIRLRSTHLLLGFGVSFMIILFLYYPLMVTGFVLAEDTSSPVIPSLWGADILLFLSGAVIFWKLFIKRKH
ncbi:MAG: translation initiation factor IF-2 N-terminal domain-containing protein [Candidatus Brocadiaceae bacterium]|nr:translation initiation factor IF-2 N-terminal domain-containing protein [Candidatus Brocadiaceae bacterium]